MTKLFTITKNTFIETIRQPVYAIIITAALLLFYVSPSISMYTMSDDNKLLRELGLSTLFIASLFIAIFSASGAVAALFRSKTIPRPNDRRTPGSGPANSNYAIAGRRP